MTSSILRTLRTLRLRPTTVSQLPRPHALHFLPPVSRSASTLHPPTGPAASSSKPSPDHPPQHHHHHHHHHRHVDIDIVPHLAKQAQHRLSLADLVKHGRPPLSADALLASARFTLSLLPIRLARRIQALRNLPYIVVSNPNISRIYNNYQHSLSTLLPWQGRTISNLDDEIRFTQVLAELVQTHTDTIPVLARGFLECRKYISPHEVTRFLDEHLRARIGTRLIAEHHIALHLSSTPYLDRARAQAAPETPAPPPPPPPPSYIGVIDTALRPASLVDSCGNFVADICELSYGVRPRWVVDGEPDTTFAFVPSHLEYILTELLKNAFRATVEHGMSKEPIVITIAPEPPEVKPVPSASSSSSSPPSPPSSSSSSPSSSSSSKHTKGQGQGQGQGQKDEGRARDAPIAPLDDNAPGVTIRIRDRGGGISSDVLPNIWSYSFTTFNSDPDDALPGSNSFGGSGGADDALGVISAASNGASSIAGLGYGLPLSRAYAEYFGGGIAVQALHGWGTDVYLRLKGVGRIA
ncbi:hypothetical protein VTJ83DRAFT_4721 [Remersonia thermophila]|uniref:Protein-serine/threonine kinase n=1 Tax=Remersonia thermophila TaxID=72144 RepID=A0ABR4DAR5_9PEZI